MTNAGMNAYREPRAAGRNAAQRMIPEYIIYKNLVFELAVVYSHFYPIFTC